MSPRTVKDDLGRAVSVPDHPQRVVCLCPSLTETLFALGAGDRLIGRTQFCVHPLRDVAELAVVGGTKTVDPAAVLGLDPDLIIAEKEENRREHVEQLARQAPVYVFDVTTVARGLAAIRTLGYLVGRIPAAESLAASIEECLARVADRVALRAAYLIWQKPLMAVGPDTYIHDLMQYCGLTNIFAEVDHRYPEVDLPTIATLGPDVVLLSSEPFPFNAQHAAALRDALPGIRVECVDGEMFAWYGSRMGLAAEYLGRWLPTLRDA
jgi:ABC-type Fe3+-hydroxamate transport system substrate-binding protein